MVIILLKTDLFVPPFSLSKISASILKNGYINEFHYDSNKVKK